MKQEKQRSLSHSACLSPSLPSTLSCSANLGSLVYLWVSEFFFQWKQNCQHILWCSGRFYLLPLWPFPLLLPFAVLHQCQWNQNVIFFLRLFFLGKNSSTC
jgi:hypothetical protein